MKRRSQISRSRPRQAEPAAKLTGSGQDKPALGENKLVSRGSRRSSGATTLSAASQPYPPRDKVAAGEIKVDSGEDRLASGEVKVDSGEDKIESGENKVDSGEDKLDMRRHQDVYRETSLSARSRASLGANQPYPREDKVDSPRSKPMSRRFKAYPRRCNVVPEEIKLDSFERRIFRRRSRMFCGKSRLICDVTNTPELPPLEKSCQQYISMVNNLQEVAKQQAALVASKQEASKQFKTLLSECQRLASVLRAAIKQHYGIRSEKLAEYNLQPFRGRKPSEKRRPKNEPELSPDQPQPGSAEAQ